MEEALAIKNTDIVKELCLPPAPTPWNCTLLHAGWICHQGRSGRLQAQTRAPEKRGWEEMSPLRGSAPDGLRDAQQPLTPSTTTSIIWRCIWPSLFTRISWTDPDYSFLLPTHSRPSCIPFLLWCVSSCKTELGTESQALRVHKITHIPSPQVWLEEDSWPKTPWWDDLIEPVIVEKADLYIYLYSNKNLRKWKRNQFRLRKLDIWKQFIYCKLKCNALCKIQENIILT